MTLVFLGLGFSVPGSGKSSEKLVLRNSKWLRLGMESLGV